eukprot:gene36025-39402_t
MVSDPEDRGRPNWYRGVDGRSVEWGGGADVSGDPSRSAWFSDGVGCLKHLCDRAEVRNDTRKTGGLPEFPIECWAQAFHRYVTTEYDGGVPWASVTVAAGGDDGGGCADDDGVMIAAAAAQGLSASSGCRDPAVVALCNDTSLGGFVRGACPAACG